jgi:hypothetical protein
MAAHRIGLTGSVLPVVALLVAGSGLGAQGPFPHEVHEPLFPLCEGCHDVGPAEAAAAYPAVELCERCHDGEQAPAVEWSAPPRDGIYAHPVHGPETGVELECQDCHGEAGGEGLATGASCSGCHAEHHGPSTRCRLCHAPSPQPLHDVRAHAGCAGSECHDPARVADLAFDRQLCLLCHTRRENHKQGRRCGDCHAVGQPGAEETRSMEGE